MIQFFANLFGYLLEFIYNIVNNYGFAIILFSIILKLILLPISIKQQNTLKKSQKIQRKMLEIRDKYGNDPERLNRETMELYKREKMNPFSGCLSGIIQIIVLLSIFYLVSKPLTFMKKVDPTVIQNYESEIKQSSEVSKIPYPEIAIIKEKGPSDESVNISMEFLGLDLSAVPNKNLTDPKVYIIPVLYVISSLVSMKISSNINKNMNKDKNKDIVVGNENKEKSEMDIMADANRNMMYLMPVMAVSISLIAPLGLALYWLVNNVLMIIERLVLNKFLKDEEEN